MSQALKLNKKYTYADLMNWPEDERWELIDGVPYAMAAPTINHQRILGNLHWKFREFLEDKTCEIFAAPCDVRLYANKDDEDDSLDDTIVQPDLLVVCDPDKLANGKAVKGAPDLIVEILSPSNSTRDTMLKFQKYRDAGVAEIWFIDPDDKITHTHIKQGSGKYSIDFYGAEDIVPVGILPGFELDMKTIF